MNKESGGASSIQTAGRPVSCEGFSLRHLADGQVTIRDDRVGETFHPVIGAMNESRQLYVAQTFLGSCWKDPCTVQKTVWDVGLGAAANAVAVFESWSEGDYGDLCLESFDRNWDALGFALKHAPVHPHSLGYLKGWEWARMLQEGTCMIQQGKRTFCWRFHQGDFRDTCLDPSLKRPDLVMYDLYSAPKCPALYSLNHWEKLGERFYGHPCLVVLHTRSTTVRVTLSLAGWFVGTGTRLGDKEETTVAANRMELLNKPLGADWLGKVRRSTAARPILNETMEAGPISSVWLEKLQNHPQWAA